VELKQYIGEDFRQAVSTNCTAIRAVAEEALFPLIAPIIILLAIPFSILGGNPRRRRRLAPE